MRGGQTDDYISPITTDAKIKNKNNIVRPNNAF
jgi:hypothetical protein